MPRESLPPVTCLICSCFSVKGCPCGPFSVHAPDLEFLPNHLVPNVGLGERAVQEQEVLHPESWAFGSPTQGC